MLNHSMKGDNKYLFGIVSRKINVKMGGRNSYLCKEIFWLNESSIVTMVIGAYVSHPKKGDRLSPFGCCGCVASKDCGATNIKHSYAHNPHEPNSLRTYFTLQRQQGAVWRSKQDLLLDFYQKNGKRRPESIIY